MATIFTTQPVTSATSTSTPAYQKGHHGEVGTGGDIFLLDANNIEIAYFRCAPGLASTKAARVAEMARIVAACITAINAL